MRSARGTEPEGGPQGESADSQWSEIAMGLARDLNTLRRQYVTLAQQETQYELSKVLTALAWAAGGLLAALVGALFLAGAVTLFVIDSTSWPPWFCATLTGLLAAAVVSLSFNRVRRLLLSVHPFPSRTLRHLLKDTAWIAGRIQALWQR